MGGAVQGPASRFSRLRLFWRTPRERIEPSSLASGGSALAWSRIRQDIPLARGLRGPGPGQGAPAPTQLSSRNCSCFQHPFSTAFLWHASGNPQLSPGSPQGGPSMEWGVAQPAPPRDETLGSGGRPGNLPGRPAPLCAPSCENMWGVSEGNTKPTQRLPGDLIYDPSLPPGPTFVLPAPWNWGALGQPGPQGAPLPSASSPIKRQAVELSPKVPLQPRLPSHVSSLAHGLLQFGG